MYITTISGRQPWGLLAAIVVPVSLALLGCGSSSTGTPSSVDARVTSDASDALASGSGGASAGGTTGTSATGGQLGGAVGAGGMPGSGGSTTSPASGGSSGTGGRTIVDGGLDRGGQGGATDASIVDVGSAGDVGVDGSCNGICPALDGAAPADSAVDTARGSDAMAIDGAAAGAACGGMNDPSCGNGLFCDWPDNLCGTRTHGTCVNVPAGVACAPSTWPVCGCDGKNYTDACEAARAGVDVSSSADCPAPAGTFRCGSSYCRKSTEYCRAQIGGVIGSPGTFSCNALPASCAGVASCACVGASMCAGDAAGGVTVTIAVP